MPDNSQRRWVVLIQKKPRGPLTETEIQTLLGKGLLRTNDLGFELDTATGKAKSDWRMLWQFPEFDRRAKAETERAAKGLPASSWVEKRGPVPTPEKIKAQVNEALPDELLHINPEDLIAGEKRAAKLDIQEIEVRQTAAREIREGGRQRMAYALVALVVFSGIGYHFFSRPPAQKRAVAADEDPGPAPAPSARALRSENRGLPSAPRSAPMILPAEPSARPDDVRNARSRDREDSSDRDRGEIAREDRDDRLDNEQENEVKEDSDSENSGASRKARRVPRRDEEDEVESAREPAEEEIDTASENWD